MTYRTYLISIVLLLLGSSHLFAEHKFKVTQVSGDVTFRAYKSFKNEPVQVGDELDAQSKVALKDGDSLEVKTPMGDVLSFKDKTFATLSKLTGVGEDKQIEVNMPLGKINCDVQKLSKESSFQIRTPSAVAGVRGTKFGVEINQNGTATINVSEGSVAVAPSTGGGASVSVGAGQSASVKAGGSIKVETTKTEGKGGGSTGGGGKSDGGSTGGGESGGGEGGEKDAPEVEVPDPPVDVDGVDDIIEELRLKFIEFNVKR